MLELSLQAHLIINLSFLLSAFLFAKSAFAGNITSQEVSFQVRPALPANSLWQDRAAPLASAGSIGIDLYPAEDLSGALSCFKVSENSFAKTKKTAGGKYPAESALSVDFRDQEIRLATNCAPYPAPASCSPLFFSVQSPQVKEKNILLKLDAGKDASGQKFILTLTGG